MDIAYVLRLLEHPAEAAVWFRGLGLQDVDRAHANWLLLAKSGLTLDLLADLGDQFAEHLPRLSDADLALNQFERFVAASRSPLALGGLMQRDREALPTLLQIFASSQHLGDLLVRDPEGFDLVRMTEGQPIAREVLVDEIWSEIESQSDERDAQAVLRRYKQREMLRIAYGDIVRGLHAKLVTRQISFLADAICEAALRWARRKLEQQRGAPRGVNGQPARFVALGLGKLGGVELNYSSDIDLIFLYDVEGQTEGPRRTTNQEFFDRLARDTIKLLNTSTEHGQAYRVDMRLRPEGAHGPIVMSLESTLHYYDVLGRTWERQAFVKARAIAGDLDLGREFLQTMQPWIYRRYLSRADIIGIRALKRRIEQRAKLEGGNERNVKTGRGGIRDIEFVIQFLQLLNGGDLPDIRTGNTLEAIAALSQVGCLTMQERNLLEENYCLLRKLEHRLQIMLDLQTHTLPEDDAELTKVAVRMGYQGATRANVLANFKSDLAHRTGENRLILDHLLHDAFGDDEETEPEVDLVLDPDPPEAFVQEVLRRHGFRDVPSAFKNLMALASEKIPFLSTRRCRLFLASIAPRLLGAIAATPDPDSTLVNLSQVSDSLGGKGVLWELFSFNPPSLRLYVHLCASCPYLAEILVSNPGMIDELMDSLVLDKLPTAAALDATLTDLCRGAEDQEPILHAFKNAQHIRVGVRDILGRADIYHTHQALADIAQACVRQISLSAYWRLAERYGEPVIAEGERAGQPCELVILALGKLGGREPNYHSDLDLIFLYEADGHTQHRNRRGDGTTNQHFFSEWGQRIIKELTHLGPYGRLYEVDPRLRPTGKSGTLAISLVELARYFAEGQGQLWERQALCKARPIFGTPEASERTLNVVREIITGHPWQPEFAASIRNMRARLQDSASPRNIKRGPGGAMDVEFATQMLQLRHAVQSPAVLTPGTLDALAALHAHGHLSEDDTTFLQKSYRFLRRVESGLRLMNTVARHDLPADPAGLHKLAHLLRFEEPSQLEDMTLAAMRSIRTRFERIFGEAMK